MSKNKISTLSRVLLILCAVLLAASIFVPLWRIELSAPQYPEGLVLQLYPDKIGGDVDAINGLNHYIGMQTLHTENFIEFTVLPYILGALALLILVTAILKSRKMSLISFILFIIFGIVSLFDFYRWNYNYGHNLDPSAAIQVPGMSYSPPVLGYKQLLNFGAYSIPDIGGMLIIAVALILAFVIFKEYRIHRIFRKKRAAAIFLPLLTPLFLSCVNDNARPVRLNQDECEECRMTIVDPKFDTQIITEKGRCLKFDDLSCLIRYTKENKDIKIRKTYVSDYLKEDHFIEAETASYIKGGEVKSPMNANIAAFETREEAEEVAKQLNAEIVSWEDIDF
ncbi:nitrous oxide reductase accessory protein NosL [uncultured Proteiniphilum sp.]|mgnify:CR=1 FL=1|uniref:nitrous oxide reductase accessory protein NosL n=1 Tax=uncultured Proteiniphilum sp. TaxID=497637 RepID=UPI00260B5B88|nr:nitrous oxide reductase accessory protein NosL [uncultured Proteiniphilum sp.]